MRSEKIKVGFGAISAQLALHMYFNNFSQTGPVGEMRVNTEMTVSVAQMFPPAVQILAGYKLAQYLVQLPDEKPTSEFTVL